MAVAMMETTISDATTAAEVMVRILVLDFVCSFRQGVAAIISYATDFTLGRAIYLFFGGDRTF